MQTPIKTTMICTNATNHGLAGYLADAGSKLSFSSIIYKAKGTGDLSLYVILTGFSYANLLVNDLATIAGITKVQLFAACVAADKRDRNGANPTLQDCENAIREQAASLQASLDKEAKSTTDEVREPVIVDGKIVPGVWTNNGSVDPSKYGDTILNGLQISKKVLEANPVRPTPTRSAGKTVAKKFLKSEFLRIGKWVGFSLTKGTDYHLKIGGSAVAQATDHGILEIDGVSTREAWEASKRVA